MGWVKRLRNFFRGDALDRDIERELRFHIAEKVDELTAAGMTEEAARQAAVRAFGNHTLQKERTREANIVGWLESIVQDLRYAVRMTARSPVFALVVVLSLAIGIGANATLFSLVDGMLLRKMPIDQPNEMVYFKWAARSNWLALSTSGTTSINETTGETTCTSFSENTSDAEIIGVTKDISIRSARDAVPATIYVPDTQGALPTATFIVRTTMPAHTLVETIRETVHQIDPNIPTTGFRTQAEAIDEAFTLERMFAGASTFFGIVAFVLASIGLFGLMAYTVERRTNEIGIRMALGATRQNVMQMVMRQTAVLILIGVTAGLAASIGVGNALSKMRLLFRVSPYDMFSLTVAVTGMIAVAFFASYIPARRASRVDPSTALRSE